MKDRYSERASRPSVELDRHWPSSGNETVLLGEDQDAGGTGNRDAVRSCAASRSSIIDGQQSGIDLVSKGDRFAFA